MALNLKLRAHQAWVLLTVYYAYMNEYRAELLLWMLSGSLPLILMGVWIQAAEQRDFGITPIALARYFLAVFLTRQFTVVWVIYDFEKEVIEGKLSPRLLQPLDPIWHHLAGHLGERFARLPFSFALIPFLFLLYPKAAWIPELGRILVFIPLILLTFALRFLIQYTLALLAFWTERATALEQFWYLFYLFLSGMIAPLSLYPPGLATVLMWTPFPYLIYIPASVLVGLPVNWLQAFGVSLAWLGIVWILNRWLWQKGLKRYSGMGA